MRRQRATSTCGRDRDRDGDNDKDKDCTWRWRREDAMLTSMRNIDRRWGGRHGQRQSRMVVAAVGCNIDVDAQRATLTGDGEEGRDEDDCARRWR
jgi:hypothetical protein